MRQLRIVGVAGIGPAVDVAAHVAERRPHLADRIDHLAPPVGLDDGALLSVPSLRVMARAWAVKLSSPPSTGAPTM